MLTSGAHSNSRFIGTNTHNLKTDLSTESLEGQEAGINNALYPKISSFPSSRKRNMGIIKLITRALVTSGDQNKEVLKGSHYAFTLFDLNQCVVSKFGYKTIYKISKFTPKRDI